MARALITGITGMAGSYLADYLLSLGYTVIGMTRRRSGGGDWRIKHLEGNPQFVLESGDVLDSGSLQRILITHQPDEIYNAAAQSYVGLSWTEPAHTFDVTAKGCINLLDAVKLHCPAAKFLQFSSSEMYGKVRETPQTEDTPHHPRSPYGVAKVAAYWATRNYRESYGMFAANAICFNMEGDRRGEEFVTRRISQAVARIKHGLASKLTLGNTDARRDWGSCEDYVKAMHLILQAPTAEDFVLATGECHTIKEFLELAFSRVCLHWQDYVEQDPKLFRPAEVDLLLGDAGKARVLLGWTPEVDFKGLVFSMVDKDMERVALELKR